MEKSCANCMFHPSNNEKEPCRTSLALLPYCIDWKPAKPEEEQLQSYGDFIKQRQFESGAVRDARESKGRCDLLPAAALLRLAKHFEAGAKHYGERNWEKGIPISAYIDSGFRHLLKYMDGQTDEDHLCAAAWNILCAMWTEEKHPKLKEDYDNEQSPRNHSDAEDKDTDS